MIPTRNHAQDPLRDLVLMTSYGKSTRLDVPVFLPEGKARRILAGERAARALPLPPAAVSFDAGFSTLCRAVARAMTAGARVEPLNNVPVSRSYPSPRALFPIEIDFVFAAEGTTLRFRYDAQHHALLLPENAVAPIRQASELRIELVAALDRIAPLYGDLAPTLCALEAGHVAYQLAAELREGGLEPQIECSASPQQYGEYESFFRNGSFVCAAVHLRGATFVAPTDQQFYESIRVGELHLSSRDRDYVERALAWLQCPSAGPKAIGSPTRAGRPMREWAMARSSGSSLSGICGKPVAREEVDDLCVTVTREIRPLLAAGAEYGLELTLLRSRPNWDAEMIRIGTNCTPVTVPSGALALADAYGTRYNIDLQTVPLVAVFSSPFAHLLAKRSSWSYMQTLVAAGALAQELCVIAAERGFFARPFKGSVEPILETAFDIEGQAFYTVLLGKNSAANPGISAQPWSCWTDR